MLSVEIHGWAACYIMIIESPVKRFQIRFGGISSHLDLDLSPSKLRKMGMIEDEDVIFIPTYKAAIWKSSIFILPLNLS